MNLRFVAVFGAAVFLLAAGARADDAPAPPTRMQDPSLVAAGTGFLISSAIAAGGSVALFALTPACTPELLGCTSRAAGYLAAVGVGAAGIGAAIVGSVLVVRGAKRVPLVSFQIAPPIGPRGGGATMVVRF